MAERKRKERDGGTMTRKSKGKSFSSSSSNNKSKFRNGKKKSKTGGGRGDRRGGGAGPRLPSALRKELDRLNPKEDADEDVGSDDEDRGKDVYEYEEGVAEEESRKNRRFDTVENYEYELPDDFQDEDVQSDDDDDDEDDENEFDGGKNKIEGSRLVRGDTQQIGDASEEEDDEGHLRMLQDITGLPREAIDGKKKKKNVVISEAYPESEYNPTRDVLDGNGLVTIEDLLEGLQGKPGYSQLRKRTGQMGKKSMTVQAPPPKEVRDKLERKAAYDKSKKDITKWEPLVKRNREQPTIIFDKDIDLGYSTVGAIASEFEPRTEFEKKMASLVNDNRVLEAYKQDGARLLELNKVSAKDFRIRQDHIAKTRSLLFRHELKLKRIKKIKSKTYHRLLKKDKMKAASTGMHMDPEAAKELAIKQERKRAEERMTLRHKNRSKWAKRILERGLNVQDDGTRAALAEQLHQHAILTRKMNSMKDSSSSDESTDGDEDEDSAGVDEGAFSKVLVKAKDETLKVLEEDDEMPTSGVLSLPFMVRGMRKRKEDVLREAKLALQEYESSSRELEGTSVAESIKTGATSGRMVFGAPKKQVVESSNKMRLDNSFGNSDDEDELETKEDDANLDTSKSDNWPKDVNSNSVLLTKTSQSHQASDFKNLDDIVGGSGDKTTYEVAILVSDTWKKIGTQNEEDRHAKPSMPPTKMSQNEHVRPIQDVEDVGEGSDSDSEGQMFDGMLSAGSKSPYELPSQAELIHEAFAGDDVEEEFTKDKEEILNKENPEPEKPILLPGWGQWTHVQKKKGLPSWMVEEHESAKRKRGEALKKRKDAHLKHVIICEKLDKKAEKLHTKTLPYPFTSKEVFEHSVRMPIGPEFNPATAVGVLTRPEVVKRPGVIIKPIKYEDVDPYEKGEEHKRSRQKRAQNRQKPKQKVNGSKSILKPVVVKS